MADQPLYSADLDTDFLTTVHKRGRATNDMLFDAFVAAEEVAPASREPAALAAAVTTQSLPDMSGLLQPAHVFTTPSASVPATPAQALAARGAATVPVGPLSYSEPPLTDALLSAYESYLGTPAMTSPAGPLFAPLDELRDDDLLGQLAAADPVLRQSLVHALVDMIQPAAAYQPIASPPALLAQANMLAAAQPELPAPSVWVNEAEASFVDSLLSLLSPAQPEPMASPEAAVPSADAGEPAAKRARVGSPKRFHCDVCNRGFSRQYNMRTHRLTHDPQSGAARPHKCRHCRRTFTRKHDLERHQVLHDDAGAFKCDVCDRAFARLDVLQRHAGAVHKDRA